jgi:hypothetical protein
MYHHCVYCAARLGTNEAIEACERAFRGTRARVSTKNSWQEAEQIAAIADDLVLSDRVRATFQRLKRSP